jgi:hypothetical protein
MTKIKSIVSIGVQDVWDIEVEDDHSYIAQCIVILMLDMLDTLCPVIGMKL